MVLSGKALFASDLLGAREPREGWEVDAEMVGHVQGYVETMRARGGQIETERHVRLSQKVAGTMDCGTFLDDTGWIYVDDLKYGFRLIEPDTEQLVVYGAAFAAELIQDGHEVRGVTTGIYQPRGFHPVGIYRTCDWTVDEILQRGAWIASRAEECHKPNPVATPGPHCADCEGATGCAALAATSTNMLALVEDHRFRHMDPQELAERLKFLRDAKKVIDAAASALETEALARFTGGERIPGWGMKERKGHRKFTAPPEAIEALTGIRPVKEVPMSPAEVKAAGATDKQLAILADRPVIGHKLEPLDPKELQRQFKR